MIMMPDYALQKEIIIDKIAQLWQSVSPEQLNRLKREMTLKTFKKNEPIYKEADKPSNLLCLIDGKVKVHKSCINGRNIIIRTIKPIEILGYRAMITGESHRTSAIAFEDSTIAEFPEELIKNLIEENSDVAMYFMNHLATLLGISDELLVNHTQKHIRGRLAETLLSLKNKYGMEADGQTLCANLSREDLAKMSNMTTSNAIRTLSAFAGEGIISIDGKNITICDIDKLISTSTLG